MNSDVIVLSFWGGLLPTILWLEFWLREARHREPRRLIVATFLLGMLSIVVAGTLETYISYFFIEFSTISFFLWALIEEVVKFLPAYFIGVKSRFCDEPIDPSIYIITSALGFSAAENIIYLSDAIREGGLGLGLARIVDRFVGASILHAVASGIVGIAIGLSFNSSSSTKRISIYTGLTLAVLLHTAFNRFIIDSSYEGVFLVFSLTWICLILTIIVLEKIKNAKKIKHIS